MAAFGSIGSVLAAPPSALARVLDDPDLIDRLGAAQAAVMEGLSEQVQRIRFDLTDYSLQQWVVGLFKGLRRERIHLALLDADRRLIFDEPLAEGSLDRVAGNLRRLVGRAIGLDAGAVVLMHNHPSGDVRPSSEDIAATRRISFLFANLDLTLEDHLVVADNAIFSMRQASML